MNTSSSHRYRSYREKKSQSKRIKTYLLRILILFVCYTLFTSFFALTVGVRGDSMNPTFDNGDSLVLLTSSRFNSVVLRKKSNVFVRGEVVLSGTNYQVEPKLWEKLLDPVVRIFSLQKKSLIYNNGEYKGRGELYRVVGLPGDTVKIKDYTIYIKPKGEEFFLSEFELTNVDYDITKKDLPDSWKEDFPFSSKMDEVFIEDNNYFLISDNRSMLNDSRVYGSVGADKIKGRVIFKYWPVNEFNFY